VTARLPLLLALLLLAGCGGEDEVRLYWVPKQLPSGHPPQGGGHDHQHDDDARPTPEDASWTLPEGWQVDPGQRAMRYVTLRAGELEVAVTQFPGSVGSLLQNVDRWRGQLGLPPAPPHELEELVQALEHPDAEVSLVDLANPESDQRLWVTLLRRPAVTWFVKTQGTVAQVDAAGEALLAFVGSLRFKAGTPASAPPPLRPAWTAPEGWTEAKAEPPRLASYAVGSGDERAEATVSSFPGQVGSLIDNVNRWRDQLGLEPVENVDALSPAPQPARIGHSDGTLVTLHGDAQTLVVAFALHEGETWFFKLRGSKALVAREAERFQAWTASVDFHPAAPGHAPGARPADAPPASAEPAAAPFGFSAPEGWTQGAARPPRLLTLRTPEGAELSVTSFPGSVGTLEANLERWRGQLGLPASGEAAIEAVTVSGAEGQQIELVGAEQAMRVASVSFQGQTWFFKLMGPAPAVAEARAGFGAFLESVELR
jgi:hypothetical protein